MEGWRAATDGQLGEGKQLVRVVLVVILAELGPTFSPNKFLISICKEFNGIWELSNSISEPSKKRKGQVIADFFFGNIISTGDQTLDDVFAPNKLD